MHFSIDQERFGRYLSSKQNTVESGSLMKSYEDTLINLSAIQKRDLPKFFYQDYIDWNFINGKNNIHFKYFFLIIKYFSI